MPGRTSATAATRPAQIKNSAPGFSALEASAAGRMENNATALKPTTRNTGSRQETLCICAFFSIIGVLPATAPMKNQRSTRG